MSAEVPSPQYEAIAHRLFPFNEVTNYEAESALRSECLLYDLCDEPLVSDDVLNSSLGFMASGFSVPKERVESFSEGALVTYKLFLLQTKNQNISLISTDPKIAGKFFSILEQRGDNPRLYMRALLNELEVTDEFFVKTLQDYMDDDEIEYATEREEKNILMLGALSLYDFLRHQCESKDESIAQAEWDARNDT